MARLAKPTNVMRYFSSCTDKTTVKKSSKHWLRLNEIYSIYTRVVRFAIKGKCGKRHKKAWILTLPGASTSKVPSQSLWPTDWEAYLQHPPPSTRTLPSTPGIQLDEWTIISFKTDFSLNNRTIAVYTSVLKWILQVHDAGRTKVQSQVWGTVLAWKVSS